MSQDRLFDSQQSQRPGPARSRQQPTEPSAAFTSSRYVSYPELPERIPGPFTAASASDYAPNQPQPMNEHTLRARYYYGTQELRPNEPVFPRPSVEDLLRRQRRSGIRESRLGPRLREAPGRFQSRLADMEDVTSALRHTLPLQNNSNAKHYEPHPNKREKILGEKYEMVRRDIDLTEDFEEVDQNIPSDFNGKRPS